MESIEQVTSDEVKDMLPADTINLLWYIWETEYHCKQIKFNLKKLDSSKQNITVFAETKRLKSFVVTLDNPVNANVFITIPPNRFIMEL